MNILVKLFLITQKQTPNISIRFNLFWYGTPGIIKFIDKIVLTLILWFEENVQRTEAGKAFGWKV